MNFLKISSFLAILIILFIEVFIFSVIFYKSFGFINIDFLISPPGLDIDSGGISSYIIGNFLLVILMTIFVFPIGVLTGLYLYEYAGRNRFFDFIRISIYNLAGVPSIVYGLFGLTFFIRFLGVSLDQFFFGGYTILGQPCILWASLTLAVLTLPNVIIATEESLKRVPSSYREASYALGANHMQNVFGVLIPSSLPGILTGLILAIGRGAGEVAPILFTGVAYYVSKPPLSVNDQFMHLGYYIYGLFTQSSNFDKIEDRLYSSILIFLVLTLIIVISIFYMRYKLEKRI